jgi:centrin-3
MASASQPHPAFPSRPYASTLHGTSKLPERNAPLGFGASSHTHTAREAARLERERQERERAAAQQQQQQAATNAGAGSMAQLTDEQRDEINEAVSHFLICYSILLFVEGFI